MVGETILTTEEQAKNAIAWIEALLSGSYRQGINYLGDEKMGFCCWGLGCMIVKKEYDPKNAWDDDFFEYVGFNNLDANIEPSLEGHGCLSNANDAGSSFENIGNYLIEHAATNFNKDVATAITNHFKQKETNES